MIRLYIDEIGIVKEKPGGPNFSKKVDLKGIEPSNLTDANRALSQLSYKPICPKSPVIITQILKK